MKFFALILTIACGMSGVAYADAPLSLKVTSSTAGGLKADTLYEINFKCEALKPLPTSSSGFNQAVKDAFSHIGATAAEYIVVSNSLPSIDPANAGQISIPSSAIQVLPIFSMKFDHVVDFRTACSGSTYVTGGQKVYLLPITSWSTQTTPGPILAAINGLAQLISPLWSLFAPFPADIGAKVSNIGPSQTAIGSILSALNKDQNYATAYSMGTGTYVVTTDFSRVTITISSLSSLLLSKPDTIQTQFTNQLNGGQKLTASADCGAIAGQLLEAGFSKTLDVPFALAWLGGRSFGAKADMINCLGRDYAMNAALISSTMLWDHITSSLRVTEQDARDITPPTSPIFQPPYSTVDPIVADIVLQLSRIGFSADPAPDALIQQLQTDIPPKVFLNDKTVTSLFGSTTALTAKDLAAALTSKGYRQFGCNSAIPTGFDNPAGGVAIFAAFKVAANAATANETDAILLEPIFENGLISTLYIYNSFSQIDTVLNANSYRCANLKIQHSG